MPVRAVREIRIPVHLDASFHLDLVLLLNNTQTLSGLLQSMGKLIPLVASQDMVEADGLCLPLDVFASTHQDANLVVVRQ